MGSSFGLLAVNLFFFLCYAINSAHSYLVLSACCDSLSLAVGGDVPGHQPLTRWHLQSLYSVPGKHSYGICSPETRRPRDNKKKIPSHTNLPTP